MVPTVSDFTAGNVLHSMKKANITVNITGYSSIHYRKVYIALVLLLEFNLQCCRECDSRLSRDGVQKMSAPPGSRDSFFRPYIDGEKELRELNMEYAYSGRVMG